MFCGILHKTMQNVRVKGPWWWLCGKRSSSNPAEVPIGTVLFRKMFQKDENKRKKRPGRPVLKFRTISYETKWM